MEAFDNKSQVMFFLTELEGQQENYCECGILFVEEKHPLFSCQYPGIKSFHLFLIEEQWKHIGKSSVMKWYIAQVSFI